MKTLLLSLAASLLVGACGPAKKRVVFFGDSITQQGAEPGGYIQQLQSMLAQRNEGNRFELLGAGISGNKVYDLFLRLDADVLAKQPAVVFIYIGINDVWHKQLLRTGTDVDKFEAFYTALIQRIQKAGADVYLCTPTVIGERNDGSNPLDTELDQYADIVRRLARTQHCGLIDLRQQFLDRLKQSNTANAERGVLTTDGVHLNAAGNQVVAEQVLQALMRIK